MRQHYNLLSFKQSLFQLFIGLLSMAFALWLFGATVQSAWVVLFTVILIGILQFLLTPLLAWIAGRFGVLGIIIVSLVSSTLIVGFAVLLQSGITLNRPIDAVFIAWVYALGITIAQWITVAQSDDVVLAEIIRKNRNTKKINTSKKPAFLFIQLDGVSWPVIDWQLKAGNLPNIGRMIDDEGYAFQSWKTQLPSTTPASQAGILLGSHKGIPAFRWYEKNPGKLMVANQPSDAAIIEKRLSSGNGLLADGGVSIGNLFSGDAPTNIMVMSKLDGDKASLKSMGDYISYFTSPMSFMRAIILSIGEMFKEIYQSRRAESQNIKPRVKRHGSYILLRAITNVFLRSLQTTIVIQNMMRGVNSIYVDYLDYDEIAHHAGIARPESLAALAGLDQIVGLIHRAKEYAPRQYEIILLSDHGQSQGDTFRQLHNGKTLEDFVAEFTHSDAIHSTDESSEDRTSSRYLVGMGKSSRSGKVVASQVSKVIDKPEENESESKNEKKSIVVTGSGNLGNIWLNDLTGRATYETITANYPVLIKGLLDTKGVGFIIVKMKNNNFVCMSAKGSINLNNGKVSGLNPLAIYNESWQDELLKLATTEHAPDIAVLSSFNPVKGEVHAFEELVGNHGGIGGWQSKAMVLHPGRLKVPKRYIQNDTINDSETLHKVLKSWINSSASKK